MLSESGWPDADEMARAKSAKLPRRKIIAGSTKPIPTEMIAPNGINPRRAALAAIGKRRSRIDPDQKRQAIPDVLFFMAAETPSDLARRCTELLRAGNDFPTIWETVLKNHALIGGVPRQRMDGKRAPLEVWLVTAQRLVFDGDAREFRLE